MNNQQQNDEPQPLPIIAMFHYIQKNKQSITAKFDAQLYTAVDHAVSWFYADGYQTTPYYPRVWVAMNDTYERITGETLVNDEPLTACLQYVIDNA